MYIQCTFIIDHHFTPTLANVGALVGFGHFISKVRRRRKKAPRGSFWHINKLSAASLSSPLITLTITTPFARTKRRTPCKSVNSPRPSQTSTKRTCSHSMYRTPQSKELVSDYKASNVLASQRDMIVEFQFHFHKLTTRFVFHSFNSDINS